MSTLWTGILAQDGDGIESLFWVVAVLILSGLGALSEKFKKKKEEQKRHWKPSRTEQPARPARRAPPRPARPATPRKQEAGPGAPPARPVPRRRVEPAPQPERHVQPIARHREEKRRPLHRRRRLEPQISGAPNKELLIQMEQRADAMLRKDQVIEAEVLPAEPMLQPTVKATTPTQPKPIGLAPIGSMKRLNIAELRRAIVMNEVLQPPLALRDMQ